MINLFNTLNVHNGAKCGEISANDVIARSAVLPLRCWSGLSRAFCLHRLRSLRFLVLENSEAQVPSDFPVTIRSRELY